MKKTILFAVLAFLVGTGTTYASLTIKHQQALEQAAERYQIHASNLKLLLKEKKRTDPCVKH